MNDYLIYVIGGILIVSVALLFVQVSTIGERIDYVEKFSEQNRVDIVQLKSELEEVKDLSQDISEIKDNLREISSGLEKIDELEKDFLKMKEDTIESMEKLQNQIDSLKKSSAFFLSPLQSPFITVVIRRGDTLAEIVDAYGLGNEGLSIIAKLNNIKNPNLVHTGQRIKVPYCLECNAILPFEGEISNGTVSKGFDEGGWVRFSLKGVFESNAVPYSNNQLTAWPARSVVA